MANNNSSNQQFTNNTDGFTIGGGTTARTVTATGSNITLTGSGSNVYTFPASTSTLASLTLNETLSNKVVQLTASTATLASQRIAIGTAPTTPVDGDIWYDSNSKSIKSYRNGIIGFAHRTLYVQNAFNSAGSNTTAEVSAIGTGTGLGTLTLPANFWVAGKRITITTKGTYQTPATPGAVTVKIKIGTTILAVASVAASILAGSSTTNEIFGEAVITCMSVTSGVAKLVSDGFLTFEVATGSTTVTFGTQESVRQGTVTASASTTVPAATVDYTVANAGLVDVTETWSTSAAQGTTIGQAKLTEES